MTLVEFLLARIAEDKAKFAVDAEELLMALRPAPNPMWQGDDAYVVLLHARLLTECEAKRRVVEEALAYTDDVRVNIAFEEVLSLLAFPYANHPDYCQEWTR